MHKAKREVTIFTSTKYTTQVLVPKVLSSQKPKHGPKDKGPNQKSTSKVWSSEPRYTIQGSQGSIHKSWEGVHQSKQVFLTNTPSPSVWLNHRFPGEEEWGGVELLPCKHPRWLPLCLPLFCSPHLWIAQGMQLFLIRSDLKPVISACPLQLLHSCRWLSIQLGSSPLPNYLVHSPWTLHLLGGDCGIPVRMIPVTSPPLHRDPMKP